MAAITILPLTILPSLLTPLPTTEMDRNTSTMLPSFPSLPPMTEDELNISSIPPSLMPVAPLTEEERYTSYYRCHYANMVVGEQTAAWQRSRDQFVAATLAATSEPAPSAACVTWVCHPGLRVWQQEEEGTEVLAYYSEGEHIEDWGQCMEDDSNQMRARNYSFHRWVLAEVM